MTLNTKETLHLIHPMKFQNLQKRSKISLGFCMCRNINVRNIVQDINGKKMILWSMTQKIILNR